VVWALGIVITALVLGLTAGTIIKSSVDAATVATSAARQGSTTGGLSTPDPLNYAVDRLFRPAAAALAQPPNAQAQTGANTPPAQAAQPSEVDREQAGGILISALANDALAPDDRTYLATRVTAVAGIPQAEAEKRVNDAFALVEKAKAQAKDAADKARHAAAVGGFLTAVAALIAAAAASAGAGLGGRHRDESGTFQIFGREHFW
jgi:hypothetical protein